MAPPPWLPTPISGDVAVLATGGMHAVVALRDGEVWLSSDGGLRWRALLPLPEHPTVTAALASPGVVIVGTAGRGVFRTDETGRWTQEGLPGRTVLTLTRRYGTVLAGTLRSGVFRSADLGRSWTAANTGLPFHGERLEVTQVAATASGWYALHAFGASRSQDDGRRWASVVDGLPADRTPVAFASLGHRLFAEVGARLYRLDAQDRWVASGTRAPLRLVGEANDALLAVLYVGHTLARSTDAGRTWANIQEGLPRTDFIAAAGATRRALFVALDGGGLWSRAREHAMLQSH